MGRRIAAVASILLMLFSRAYAGSVTDRQKLFDEICGVVEENFYDADRIKSEFPKMRDAYRPRVEPDMTQEQFTSTVNEMLRLLQASHTYYLSPADPEYYQLASIFSQLPEMRNVFGGRDIEYPTVGIITEKNGNETFIADALPGGPAEKAGLLRGDRIVSVDGRPYQAVDSFTDFVGKDVTLVVQRTAGQEIRSVVVVPQRMNPTAEMLRAQMNSMRVIAAGGVNIGYIHIYSYAGQEFHDELVSAISWGALKDADALIIDLRYGLGGADPSYLNIFNRNVPVIDAVERDGQTRHYDPQWRKPAVYLINHATRSGKEILAFGAKKFGLATLVGERTAGAVLAGRLFVLSNNDLVYLAVNRSVVDGVVLEGVGVAPDIEIPDDIRYKAGGDVQLQAAVTYLQTKLLEKTTDSERAHRAR